MPNRTINTDICSMCKDISNPITARAVLAIESITRPGAKINTGPLHVLVYMKMYVYIYIDMR